MSDSKRDADADLHRFQLLDPVKHVLKRPAMYAGSPNMQLVWRWVLQQLGKRMVFKEIAYVGVVLKMFDEIVVNARDHSIDEANKVTQINVEVDAATGCFVVHNTGFGFPVKKHPETGLYIADMMLGHLRTSTNYDDDTRRVTGGMNGLGAKIANIMSTEFTVTSADPAGRKFFSTTWRNNMSEADEAVIESCSVKEAKEIGTRVTWTPDYVRFDMTPRLSADFIALLRKRVVDLAVTTSKKVTVSFNGEEIRMRNFENYVAAYVGDKKQEHPRVYRSSTSAGRSARSSCRTTSTAASPLSTASTRTWAESTRPT